MCVWLSHPLCAGRRGSPSAICAFSWELPTQLGGTIENEFGIGGMSSKKQVWTEFLWKQLDPDNLCSEAPPQGHLHAR